MNRQLFQKMEILCPNPECKVEQNVVSGRVYYTKPKLKLIIIGFFGEARFQCPRCQQQIELNAIGDADEILTQNRTISNEFRQRPEETNEKVSPM